jgi:hypothetical protein
MPPGLVLKPWSSQGSLDRAGTWRIWRLWELRVVQPLSEVAELRDLGALRLRFDVRVGDTGISV